MATWTCNLLLKVLQWNTVHGYQGHPELNVWSGLKRNIVIQLIITWSCYSRLVAPGSLQWGLQPNLAVSLSSWPPCPALPCQPRLYTFLMSAQYSSGRKTCTFIRWQTEKSTAQVYSSGWVNEYFFRRRSAVVVCFTWMSSQRWSCVWSGWAHAHREEQSRLLQGLESSANTST